jgi:hypothetical protein
MSFSISRGLAVLLIPGRLSAKTQSTTSVLVEKGPQPQRPLNPPGFPRKPQSMRTLALLRLSLPQFLQRGRIAIDSPAPVRGGFASLHKGGQSPYFN